MHILAPNNIVQRYPYTDAQMMRDNPQVSFPGQITDAIRALYGVYPVQPVAQPEYNPATHRPVERAPEFAEGVWQQVWEIIPVSVVIVDVSPRQIRQAMNRVPYGEGTLRDVVEAAVSAGDQDLKDWWLYSTAFERENPQVSEMAEALGVSESSLNDLWILASSL